ncbi:hypothetical protein FRB99_001684 [Tulasnella sp. 403]|nr:hypothetical protein FRB99_001684 [Tulasnella sp. 403]
MPLLLGTKRSHSQTASDDEDDHSTITTTSYKTAKTGGPSVASTRRSLPQILDSTKVSTPLPGCKQKLPRHSMPIESPGNMFRIGNDTYWRKLRKGPGSLPASVSTLLELRLQLKRANLVLFLFGWEGPAPQSTSSTSNPDNSSTSSISPDSPHPHNWRLVKKVSMFSDKKRRAREIEASQEWIRLYPTSRFQEECEKKMNDSFDVAAVSIEDEEKWSIGKLWGPGGIFSERGAVYNYGHDFRSIVDVTLIRGVLMRRPTNLPRIIAAKGAPMCERTTEHRTKEVPENKIFTINTFKANSFERWLKGEVYVCLDSDRIAVLPKGDNWPIKRLPQRTYAHDSDENDHSDPPTELEIPEDANVEMDPDEELSGPSPKRVKLGKPKYVVDSPTEARRRRKMMSTDI